MASSHVVPPLLSSVLVIRPLYFSTLDVRMGPSRFSSYPFALEVEPLGGPCVLRTWRIRYVMVTPCGFLTIDAGRKRQGRFSGKQ